MLAHPPLAESGARRRREHDALSLTLNTLFAQAFTVQTFSKLSAGFLSACGHVLAERGHECHHVIATCIE